MIDYEKTWDGLDVFAKMYLCHDNTMCDKKHSELTPMEKDNVKYNLEAAKGNAIMSKAVMDKMVMEND